VAPILAEGWVFESVQAAQREDQIFPQKGIERVRQMVIFDGVPQNFKVVKQSVVQE
jgi:hypothetical protein